MEKTLDILFKASLGFAGVVFILSLCVFPMNDRHLGQAFFLSFVFLGALAFSAIVYFLRQWERHIQMEKKRKLDQCDDS